jgi:hypothetical protein
MSKFKDLTGLKFGRLMVIKRAENCGHHTRWLCKCDCGNETISHTTSLTSGRTKSCGCKNKEDLLSAVTTHGGRKTELYKHWCLMKTRCYYPKYDHYDRYGARGIIVCPEWENDFATFREWAVNNGYVDGLQIDRINTNGNYEPANCRWINRTQQVRNRTNTLFFEIDGINKPFAEWCEIHGVNYKKAHQRYKAGWSVERIFEL